MSQPVTAPTSPGVIILKPSVSLAQGYNEYRAKTATVKPGHLLEVVDVDANGFHTVKPLTFTGSQLYAERRLVALENAYRADIPGAATVLAGTIDDTYAAGDLVPTRTCVSGDMMYMFLASGNTTAVGSMLTSNGDGTLRLSTGANPRLFRALEVVVGSASARVRVEAI